MAELGIAGALLQHDTDASPLFPRFEIPLTGRSRFAATAAESAALPPAAGRTGGGNGRRRAGPRGSDYGRFLADVTSVYTGAIVGDWLAGRLPA